ncbi:MAG TPA: hypothetical protein VFH88_05160 [Candidatus Krumholzibacteria bacterium]|nr:hypothetical protein [Candidatus Krumholzibacteria bacterium]
MTTLLFAVLLLAGPVRAASPDSVQVAPVDFHAAAGDPGLRYSFDEYMLRNSPGSSTGYLAVSLRDPQLCPTPTRFDAILGGAGAATSLGMFIGAVGTSLGWFSEDTSWAITGAMAAVGALYGGARYQVQSGLNFDWQGDSVIPGYARPLSR